MAGTVTSVEQIGWTLPYSSSSEAIFTERDVSLDQSEAMPEFIPSGYLSMREAVNRLGHELFRSEWTGEEHKARHGLISEAEWLRIKDLPPPRGADALGGGRRHTNSPAAKAATRWSGDPSDPCTKRS